MNLVKVKETDKRIYYKLNDPSITDARNTLAFCVLKYKIGYKYKFTWGTYFECYDDDISEISDTIDGTGEYDGLGLGKYVWDLKNGYKMYLKVYNNFIFVYNNESKLFQIDCSDSKPNKTPTRIYLPQTILTMILQDLGETDYEMLVKM